MQWGRSAKCTFMVEMNQLWFSIAENEPHAQRPCRKECCNEKRLKRGNEEIIQSERLPLQDVAASHAARPDTKRLTAPPTRSDHATSDHTVVILS